MFKVELLYLRDLVDVQRAVGRHGSADLHVIADIVLHRVRIGDRDHLLIAVVHQYSLFAGANALLAQDRETRSRPSRRTLSR